MGIGMLLLEIVAPFLEFISPIMPGEIFPYFFKMEMFQRAFLAAIMVTIVAGFLGVFLLMQNLALIGDGLAHVSFGGVAVGVVLGATSPLWYALIFSITAAILIHEMQSREILTGDASIAIFLTGMLALGLVILRIGGGGITTDIEGYLFGNLLLIDESSLDLIAIICIVSIIFLAVIRSALLACTIDPVAARIQGLPVRGIGLLFSVITAAVVVSMVQVVGTLLVTALLVTPAATAQKPPTNQVALTIISTSIPETFANSGLSETARIPLPIFVLVRSQLRPSIITSVPAIIQKCLFGTNIIMSTDAVRFLTNSFGFAMPGTKVS